MRRIRNLPFLAGSRWLVVLAGCVAAGFLFGGLLSSTSLFRSFVMGGVSALIVMGVGAWQRAYGEAGRWRRSKVAAGVCESLARRSVRFGRSSAG
jgi:hypothetical protein